MKHRLWMFAAVLLLLVGSFRLEGQTLYASNSNLYTINPATALATLVGPIGFTRVTGLAVNPITGVMYGSVGKIGSPSPHSLISINKTTGAGTLIGDFGVGADTAADLAFDSSGNLYGWFTSTSQNLYRINLSTGAATLVGSSGLTGTHGDALAFSPGGTLFFVGSGTGGALRTLNPATGAPATVATLSGAPNPSAEINAMEFNPGGTLFAVNSGDDNGTGFLITINTSTGAITSIGPIVTSTNPVNVFVVGVDGLAFDAGGAPPPPPGVPAPPTILLMLLGMMGLAGYALRRKFAQ